MGKQDFDRKYWDNAMVGLREYTPGGSPFRSYRIADGELHVLLENMRSTIHSPVGLEARGDVNEFWIYEHDQLMAHVKRVGNALHVDSTPSRHASHPHAEAVFYQRFWSALAAYTSACDA